MSTQRLLDAAEIPVATFASAREFLDAFDPEATGCVVSDVRMPDMSGLELQEELVHRGCRIPVIMITGYADVPMAVRSMKAGAIDFIEKPFPPSLLLERIRIALDVRERARSAAAEQEETERNLARLTPRQRQVLDLVLEGRTSRAIGSELVMSPKTVDVHRAEIKEKLGAGSIAELTRMVVTARLAAATDGEQSGNGARARTKSIALRRRTELSDKT